MADVGAGSVFHGGMGSSVGVALVGNGTSRAIHPKIVIRNVRGDQ